MIMFTDNHSRRVKTVTQITREIKSHFDQNYHFVSISGEISNLKKPHSGHLYFNLKDEHSQLRAVLFRNKSRYLDQQLRDGQQVVCDGRITVYEPRGEYQIVVDSVDFHGSGALQIAFEKLKKRLHGEGLFDQEHKQPLPAEIKKIALITSPSGAAVHDFLSICYQQNADIQIQILPARVQGEGSVEEIAAALSRVETLEPDVVVLCRGGGSIEDLWTFNEERIARAIHSCPIPVVSAIGHEIDITIADYCADVRCATPTAAAELLVPEFQELQNKLKRHIQRIIRSMQWQFRAVQFRIEKAERVLTSFDSAFATQTVYLDSLTHRLHEAINHHLQDRETRARHLVSRLQNSAPINTVTVCEMRLSHLSDTLLRSMQVCIEKKRAQLQEIAAILDSVSPLATLSRGYSIVSKPDTGEIVTDGDQVRIDERVAIKLKKGALQCKVEKHHR